MSALVIYFSQTGHTEKAAGIICERAGIQRFRIYPKTPYPTRYDALEARALKEVGDRLLPLLGNNEIDARRFAYIFLGFPIWYGMPAAPVMTFLNRFDWKGRTVFPFITFGGLYGRAFAEMEKILRTGGAAVKDELLLRFPYRKDLNDEEEARIQLMIVQWIEGIKRRYGTNIRK